MKRGIRTFVEESILWQDGYDEMYEDFSVQQPNTLTGIEDRINRYFVMSESELRSELEKEYIKSIPNTWAIMALLMQNSDVNFVKRIKAIAQEWLIDRPDFIHYLEDLARSPSGLLSDIAIQTFIDAGMQNAYVNKTNFKSVTKNHGTLIKQTAFSLLENSNSSEKIDLTWISNLISEIDQSSLHRTVEIDIIFNKTLYIYSGVKIAFDMMDGISTNPLGVNNESAKYLEDKMTLIKSQLIRNLNKLNGTESDKIYFDKISARLPGLPAEALNWLHQVVHQTVLDIHKNVSKVKYAFEPKGVPGVQLIQRPSAAGVATSSSVKTLYDDLVVRQLTPLFSKVDNLLGEVGSLDLNPKNIDAFANKLMKIQNETAIALIKSEMLNLEMYLLFSIGIKGVKMGSSIFSSEDKYPSGLELRSLMYKNILKVMHLLAKVDKDPQTAVDEFSELVSGEDFNIILGGVRQAEDRYEEFHELAQIIRVISAIVLPLYASMAATMGMAFTIQRFFPALYSWGTTTLTGKIVSGVSSVMFESLIFETAFKAETGQLGEGNFAKDYWKTAALFGIFKVLNLAYLSKIKPIGTAGAKDLIKYELKSGISHFAVFQAWQTGWETYEKNGELPTLMRQMEIAKDNVMMLSYLKLVMMATQPLAEQAIGEYKLKDIKRINENLTQLRQQAKKFATGEVNFSEAKQHASRTKHFLLQRRIYLEAARGNEKSILDNKTSNKDQKAASQYKYDAYNVGIKNVNEMIANVDYNLNVVIRFNLKQLSANQNFIQFEGLAEEFKNQLRENGYKESGSNKNLPKGMFEFFHPQTGKKITFIQASTYFYFEREFHRGTLSDVAESRGIDLAEAKMEFGSDEKLTLNTLLRTAIENGWRPEHGRNNLPKAIQQKIKEYNIDLLKDAFGKQNTLNPQVQQALISQRTNKLQTLVQKAGTPEALNRLFELYPFFETMVDFNLYVEYAEISLNGGTQIIRIDKAPLLDSGISFMLKDNIDLAIKVNTLIEQLVEADRSTFLIQFNRLKNVDQIALFTELKEISNKEVKQIIDVMETLWNAGFTNPQIKSLLTGVDMMNSFNNAKGYYPLSEKAITFESEELFVPIKKALEEYGNIFEVKNRIYNTLINEEMFTFIEYKIPLEADLLLDVNQGFNTFRRKITALQLTGRLKGDVEAWLKSEHHKSKIEGKDSGRKWGVWGEISVIEEVILIQKQSITLRGGEGADFILENSGVKEYTEIKTREGNARGKTANFITSSIRKVNTQVESAIKDDEVASTEPIDGVARLLFFGEAADQFDLAYQGNSQTLYNLIYESLEGKHMHVTTVRIYRGYKLVFEVKRNGEAFDLNVNEL